MSAILPPSRPIWWKQPLDRVEGTWIVIALLWCLIMFFMMPYWHVYGKQNLSNEAYRTTPEAYLAKAQAIAASVQKRMMFNRWHFIPGNVERERVPRTRHWYYPPLVPLLDRVWPAQRHDWQGARAAAAKSGVVPVAAA